MAAVPVLESRWKELTKVQQTVGKATEPAIIFLVIMYKTSAGAAYVCCIAISRAYVGGARMKVPREERRPRGAMAHVDTFVMPPRNPERRTCRRMARSTPEVKPKARGGALHRLSSLAERSKEGGIRVSKPQN